MKIGPVRPEKNVQVVAGLSKDYRVADF